MTLPRVKATAICSALVLAFFAGHLNNSVSHVLADQPKPDNTRLKQLLRDRVDAKKRYVDLLIKLNAHKAAIALEIQLARIDVLRAELDLVDAKTDRVGILEQMLKLRKQIVLDMENQPGCRFGTELIQYEVAVIEAEIELEREKLKP